MNESRQARTQKLRALAAMHEDAPYGLDGDFYTSNKVFEWEKNTLLRTGWHCLGRADEISKPGDFFTSQLLEEPLLIVRGKDGTIRVLSNICRHRNMIVARGSGNHKLFTCPYHAWSYDTQGALVRAPNFTHAAFDPANCALPAFKSEIWQGFIFVNLDDSAASLSGQLNGLDELIGVYHPETYRIVHVAEEVWACNWKCLVENFMEGYHLSVVHPQTLRGYTPTELCTKGPSSPAFTSYHANYPDNIPARGKGAPALDPKQRHRSTLFNIFPAQVASISASLLVSLSLQPLTVDSIRVRWTMSVYGDDLDPETIAQRISLWSEVNAEDRIKLELLQKGLNSSKATAGPLAAPDFEGTIRDFHLYLARLTEKTD